MKQLRKVALAVAVLASIGSAQAITVASSTDANALAQALGGAGITGVVDGRRWRLESGGAGVVRLVDDAGAASLIRMGDVTRRDAADTVAALRGLGLRVVLLTGDHPEVARQVAAGAGIDEVLAGADPEAKRAAIRRFRSEGHRVLFAGDVAMKAQPAFASPTSSLTHWLDSLDQLAALRPTIVVPSHGPIGDAGFMTEYRTYLTTIRSRVTALKSQGRTVDQITPVLTAELKERYPDAGRLAGAIRVAFAEAR